MEKQEDNVLDDIFGTSSSEGTKQEEPKTEEPKAEAPSSSTKEEQSSSTKMNSDEDHDLTADLGPVDDSYMRVDTSEIKRFEYGRQRVQGSNDYETNKDTLIAFIDVKESFAPEADEKHIKIKNNKHDNNMIKHVFGPYHVYDFDTLAKLTEPKNLEAVKEAFHKKGQEFKFDVYRSSFNAERTDANGNKTNEIQTFFKLTNRPGGKRNTYSEYYQSNGGFPSMPDGFLNQQVNPTTGHLYGKILSVNMNTAWNRFEIEFEPVNSEGVSLFSDDSDSTPAFRDNAKANDIHSYLATYKFNDNNDPTGKSVDTNKRSRQAGKISAALGVQDFVEWDNTVGQIKEFRIQPYENKFKGNGTNVYRAFLV